MRLKLGFLSVLIFSIVLGCERNDFETNDIFPSKDYSSILKELEYNASIISQKKKDKASLRVGLPENSNNPHDQIGIDHYDFLVALNNDTALFNQQFANSLSSNIDVKKIQIFEHMYNRIEAGNLINLSATDSSSIRSFLVTYTSETENPINNYSAEDGYTTAVKNFLNSYISATTSYRESNDYESITDVALLYEDTFANDYNLSATESEVVYKLLTVDKYQAYFFNTTSSGAFFKPWYADIVCIGGAMVAMASLSPISPYLGGLAGWWVLRTCYNQ